MKTRTERDAQDTRISRINTDAAQTHNFKKGFLSVLDHK